MKVATRQGKTRGLRVRGTSIEDDALSWQSWQMPYVPWSRSESRKLALFLCVAVACVFQSQAQIPNPQSDLLSSPGFVTIRDGTAVEMRFAQMVIGKGPDARIDAGDTPDAVPGDTVRLISTSDIRVEGATVIAKGARGQATVMKVKNPLTTLSYSGISLRLDWIEGVTGQRLSLRAKSAGESRPFMITIVRDATGVVAGTDVEKNQSIRSTLYDRFIKTKQMQYIPVGARTVGYIHGSTSISTSKLPKLSEDSPTPAILTIFRMQDRIMEPIEVVCDGKRVAELRPEQYASMEVPLGSHSCQASDQQPLMFFAEHGLQYFVRLQARDRTLAPVSVGEGEDCLENLGSVTVP